MRAGIIALATAGVLATSAGVALGGLPVPVASVAGTPTSVTTSSIAATSSSAPTASRFTSDGKWWVDPDNTTIGIGHLEYTVTGGAIVDGHGSIQVQPIGQAPNMHVAVTHAHLSDGYFSARFQLTWPNGSSYAPVSGTGQVGGGKLTGEIRLEDGQYLRIGNLVLRPVETSAGSRTTDAG